ncbi:hypothetical protein ACGF8B_29445 [Streptomyces sp. NPDC047917]
MKTAADGSPRAHPDTERAAGSNAWNAPVPGCVHRAAISSRTSAR